LALNADGTGRVDIDTDGGLECHGSGPGGTSPGADNGIAIKVDPAAGNSLQVASAGVFVPPAFRFEILAGTIAGGAVTDPGFGEGGSLYVSSLASLTLTNTTAYGKAFLYQAAVYYGSDDTSDPFWVELAVQEAGGGWNVPSAQYVTAGSIVSPVMMLPQYVTVAAGETKQMDARMHLYRGNVDSWRVTITAWGGYS
jgi:hypothetical protein